MADAATYPVGTIAKLLMISERRVQQLTKDGVIPKSERGRYELAPAVQGYIKFLSDRNLKVDGNVVIDFNAEKARKTKAEADLAEMEAAKTKGDLVLLRDVERGLEYAFAEIKTNLRSVPSRVVGRIVGETEEHKIKEAILDEIDNVLDSLAKNIDFDQTETLEVDNAEE